MHVVVLRNLGGGSVCGDARNLSACVILKSVKWALDMVIHEFAGAEGSAPVAALVIDAMHGTRRIPPENKLLGKPRDAYEFILLNLSGIQ